MKAEFTVFGEPVAKGRPKVTRYATYTPEKTKKYEMRIKSAYLRHPMPFFADKPLRVKVVAFYNIPQSASKAKREKMLAGKMLPTKRPDLDNIVKAIVDALNKVAYKDDSQIVCIEARKYYSNSPRVEVYITDV